MANSRRGTILRAVSRVELSCSQATVFGWASGREVLTLRETMTLDPLRPVDGPLLGVSPASDTGAPQPPGRWSRRRRLVVLAVMLLAIYVVAAYVIAPRMWRLFSARHPALDDLPEISRTGSGIPGDPTNVGLIGAEADVIGIMLAAKWHPADPITLRSSVRIAAASLLHRPYPDAPVSNLYLWGRKENLAFQ